MKEFLDKILKTSAENELLEFKEAKNQYDKNKLGKYFSALCNEANLNHSERAWIIFGVKDNKTIVGTNISEKQINEYKQEIANHTSPSVGFKNVYIENTAKGRVILLEIPPAPNGMPIAWKTHYYARNGDSLSGLNIEKVERIRSQIKLNDWSATILENATVEDLCNDAIEQAKKNFKQKNKHLITEIDNWDTLTFLNKAKLTIKGKITHTTILLLGKSESEHFIIPSSCKISWILKDRDNIEKDYEHFTCPLLLSIDKVRAKIRNLTYRYLQEGTLFPQEVEQFDAYIIREALNNCIAHQDYKLGGKINVIEKEDGILTFINSGSFIPKSIDKVIDSDAPETVYRNSFLTNAMVNLNMIDTIGSGIKKMFVIQKNKYFPLPEYDLSHSKVKVTFTGKVIDLNYARKLALHKDLSLTEIVLLDKVVKSKPLNNKEIKILRSKKLIEGRKPNLYISAKVASYTGEKAKYIKQRGVDDAYYMKLMIDYLIEFKTASRKEFENLLLDKLPEILTNTQKQNKVKNFLQKLKKDNRIKLEPNRIWTLDEI